MNIQKKKIDFYKDALSVYLKKLPTDKMLNAYFQDGICLHLQDFIGDHMKPPLKEWATAMSILDSVEAIIKDSMDNGNIKYLESPNK